MATTVTSSVPLVTRAALFDELYKIAEAQPVESKKAKFKRWAKITALNAAGAGAGTAAFMGADKLFGKKLGKTWRGAGTKTKMLAGGLVGLGSTLIGQKLMDARRKAQNE